MQIVEKAKILHLGLFDSEYPYVLPLHYGYEYVDGSLVFYLHSAKEGHTMISAKMTTIMRRSSHR